MDTITTIRGLWLRYTLLSPWRLLKHLLGYRFDSIGSDIPQVTELFSACTPYPPYPRPLPHLGGSKQLLSTIQKGISKSQEGFFLAHHITMGIQVLSRNAKTYCVHIVCIYICSYRRMEWHLKKLFARIWKKKENVCRGSQLLITVVLKGFLHATMTYWATWEWERGYPREQGYMLRTCTCMSSYVHTCIT